jgi:hypothetical protein
MPKAAVNENYLLSQREYQIGAAREVLSMKPKAIAE